MTLSVDRVLPSSTPDSWDLAEIFAYAVAYGLYLTLSTYVLFTVSNPGYVLIACRIILVVVILESDFFQNKFNVHLNSPAGQIDHNDKQLHTIVYLQVAIISQALIFVTRAHGFFFMERPSFALMGAFCLAQLVSSIIAGFANWGFTSIQKISGGWIGIVWVWVRLTFH
jgi:H+-transporting ATPase